MLSSRLVRLVAERCNEITDRVVLRLQRDAKLHEFGKLPERELRERTCDILSNLGRWLISKEEDLGHRYEELGRRRYEEGIPLHEVVYALQLIRECMIQYVRDQGLGMTPLELYAEEELEHGSDRIFDRIIYYFVRGYERAMRQRSASAA